MNAYTRDTSSRPLAADGALVDNIPMTDGSSATKTGHRSIVRHIEYQLVCIGMSVIAYLLERAVLRSIKRGTEP